MMKYYLTDCGKLIKYNPETNTYKIRNTIERIDTRVSHDDFNKLYHKEIKRDEFARLMNVFFKEVSHSWKFENAVYTKLENFKQEGNSLSTNYVLGKDVPFHNLSGYGECVLVYHWGKVYYHSISYNGYSQGQLICTKTLKTLRWARLKHCSPILNKKTKKIC